MQLSQMVSRMSLLSWDVSPYGTEEPSSVSSSWVFQRMVKPREAMDRLWMTLRTWSSPKWFTGCPCYPRMCHLAVSRQMRPSRQYCPQIQIREPANPNPWDARICGCPSGICRFIISGTDLIKSFAHHLSFTLLTSKLNKDAGHINIYFRIQS